MTDFPHIPKRNIEDASIQLLKDYHSNTGESIKAPIPVFEMIEYLGYDVDFRNDGIYKDSNILGGLRIKEKKVEINENLEGQEGRMNFTAAHEVGHIVLHVPLLGEDDNNELLELNYDAGNNILCRKDEGFEDEKKEPQEWQADKFAAFMLMPTDKVRSVFFRIFKRPINVKRKRLLELIFPRSPIFKAYKIAEKIIKTGSFDNVSKMAMLNRLIGMKLVNGLSYQKSKR
jgi:Zn-dependent peptidase ImmA (M78 family)